jgi:hypothetical protein
LQKSELLVKHFVMANFPERVQGGSKGFCELLRKNSFCLVPLTDEESSIISSLLDTGKFLFFDPHSRSWPKVEDLASSSLLHSSSSGTRDTWFTGFKTLKQRQVNIP